MYLADILAEKYDINFAVTDKVLDKLVLANGYKTIWHSGIKPLIRMESNFIAFEKKQKVNFWNKCKTLYKNEVYKFRKRELNSIIEKTKAEIVIIDIFSSTDFLVLNNHPRKPKLLFFNPMLSTCKVNGFPIVSEGTWATENTGNIKERKLGFKDFIKQPKESILFYLNEKQTKLIFAESGISEDILDKNNSFTKMFKGITEIILAPLEFEFSPNVRQNWQYYIGLCTNEKRQDTEIDITFDNFWQEILIKKQNGTKVIYCSFGTFYTGPDKSLLKFIETLIEAVEKFDNVHTVISINRFLL